MNMFTNHSSWQRKGPTWYMLCKFASLCNLQRCMFNCLGVTSWAADNFCLSLMFIPLLFFCHDKYCTASISAFPLTCSLSIEFFPLTEYCGSQGNAMQEVSVVQTASRVLSSVSKSHTACFVLPYWTLSDFPSVKESKVLIKWAHLV